MLLINRGVGLRLPKDNTLSLPFGPGFLSRCPSLCPLLQEGELLWAVSPTPREAAGSGGLLAGGLFWLRGDGPGPRLPVCTWIPLGPIVQWLRSVLAVPWSLRDGCQCLLWVNTPTVNLMYLLNFWDTQPAAWGVDLWDHPDTCACSSLGSAVTVVSMGLSHSKATGALRGPAPEGGPVRAGEGGNRALSSGGRRCALRGAVLLHPRVKWPHASGTSVASTEKRSRGSFEGGCCESHVPWGSLEIFSGK